MHCKTRPFNFCKRQAKNTFLSNIIVLTSKENEDEFLETN